MLKLLVSNIQKLQKAKFYIPQIKLAYSSCAYCKNLLFIIFPMNNNKYKSMKNKEHLPISVSFTMF